MNFRLMAKVNQVENRVNNLNNYQQQILNTVNGQVNQIQNVMNDIRREQSWISSINMDVKVNDTKVGKANANFEWQIKELHANSDVNFHYTFGDSEDYQTVPAKQLENGLFQVSIPVEIDMKPQWEIHTTMMGSAEEEVSKRVMEERMEQQYRQHSVNYFVSVTDDDMVKSSEKSTRNLSGYGTRYYGFIMVNMNPYGDNFNVTVIKEKSDSSSDLKEVHLLSYQNGSLIGDEKLNSNIQENTSTQKPVVFESEKLDPETFTRLVVKITYNNGESFEKEIYQEQ